MMLDVIDLSPIVHVCAVVGNKSPANQGGTYNIAGNNVWYVYGWQCWHGKAYVIDGGADGNMVTPDRDISHVWKQVGQ